MRKHMKIVKNLVQIYYFFVNGVYTSILDKGDKLCNDDGKNIIYVNERDIGEGREIKSEICSLNKLNYLEEGLKRKISDKNGTPNKKKRKICSKNKRMNEIIDLTDGEKDYDTIKFCNKAENLYCETDIHIDNKDEKSRNFKDDETNSYSFNNDKTGIENIKSIESREFDNLKPNSISNEVSPSIFEDFDDIDQKSSSSSENENIPKKKLTDKETKILKEFEKYISILLQKKKIDAFEIYSKVLNLKKELDWKIKIKYQIFLGHNFISDSDKVQKFRLYLIKRIETFLTLVKSIKTLVKIKKSESTIFPSSKIDFKLSELGNGSIFDNIELYFNSIIEILKKKLHGIFPELECWFNKNKLVSLQLTFEMHLELFYLLQCLKVSLEYLNEFILEAKTYHIYFSIHKYSFKNRNIYIKYFENCYNSRFMFNEIMKIVKPKDYMPILIYNWLLIKYIYLLVKLNNPKWTPKYQLFFIKRIIQMFNFVIVDCSNKIIIKKAFILYILNKDQRFWIDTVHKIQECTR